MIFDPWATAKSRKRARWQVFRRVARKGLVCVETSMEDRVQSRSLGAWLRRVDVGGHTRLRIGYGERGEELVPTDEEVAEAERTVRRVIEAQANAERLARQTAEEHARAVEAELAAVRAELEQLRRGG